MKITDVTVTLFAWDDIPARQYGRHTGRFGGKSELGLVTITTDEGVVGHAFLGSSKRGAQLDAASLIRFLKPLVMGQNPLDRERLYQQMWRGNRNTTLRASARWTSRSGISPARSRDCRSTACSARTGTSVRAYASSAVLPLNGGLRARRPRASRPRAGPAYKIHPPTRCRRRHRDLPRRAQGGRRRLHGDARQDVGLQLPGGAAGRPRARRARLLLVRGSARRRRHLQLREAQAEARHPDPGDRVLAGRLQRLRAVDHGRRHRLPARRRRGEGRHHARSSRSRTSPKPST